MQPRDVIAFARPREPDRAAAHLTHEIEAHLALRRPLRFEEAQPLLVTEAIAADTYDDAEILAGARYEAKPAPLRGR